MEADNANHAGTPGKRFHRLPLRLSVLCLVGLLVSGSTALGYYYYYVYRPPLSAAEAFLDAMAAADGEALAQRVLIRTGTNTDDLRVPRPEELEALLSEEFVRGNILDQRKREGGTRTYHYLVYREPDGQIYALLVSEFQARYHVVIPDAPMSDRRSFLWDYTWTN